MVHKYTKEEVMHYYAQHTNLIYFNRDDQNIFVPNRFGFAPTFNFAHPITWLLLLGIILLSAVLVLTIKTLLGY